MIKNKKQMFIVITAFALVLLLGTTTYAFFNYTRTGEANTIRVGRISFVSRQQQTITLTDLFPIDPEEPNIMNDTTKVGTLEIEIEGDTDYVGGIEYLVTTTNPHIYTSEGTIVPISLDVTVSGLGSPNNNYFTARNSKDTTMYKILSAGEVVGEQQLLVGYIKKNTTSGTAEGVNGSITIKAYIDENKIAITDTPDENSEWQRGRTVISTEEWNAIKTSGVSFQVKVEANEDIWVGEPFYEVMKRSTVMDNINSTYVNNSTPGIDFTAISSDTNGKGIYTYSSTADDAYPVMYYRGDVDNNVLFGGFCWKIVRTTDTGGIKLIYNGNPVNNQCGNDRILEKNQVVAYGQVLGNVNTDYTYYSSDSYEYDATNKVFRLTGNVTQNAFSEQNVNNLIGKYTCFPHIESETCSTLKKINSYVASNEIYYTQITVDSSIILDNNDIHKNNVNYNVEVNTPASVGYMYGTNYIIKDDVAPTTVVTSYYGSGFTYENGVYKLTDPVKLYGTNVYTHHYSCGSTDPNGTCNTIMYFVRVAPPNFNYISLTGGKSIEDALDEMFTNTNDSLAKTMIDTWYSDNMTNNTNKLEDTIYCNDRSIRALGAYDPDGGNTSSNEEASLKFSSKVIKCPKKRDSFTVSSEKGNGKLDYPVGMITNVEAELAGAIWGLDNPNTNFYLYDGNGYWTMTPNSSQIISFVQRVYEGGNHGGTRIDLTDYMSGFRPVISLKEGTSVTSGTGTPTDPYVIE